jgi:hypothetical protein
MVADSPLPNNQQRGDDGKLSRQYVLGQTVYESPSISRSHLGQVKSLVTAAYVGFVGLICNMPQWVKISFELEQAMNRP